jgi:integrase
MGWRASLRLHASGQYFFRHGGKDHYLGKDEGAAQAAFRAYIAAMEGAKAGGAPEPVKVARASVAVARPVAPAPESPSVRETAERLWAWADKRRAERTSAGERHHLAPFLRDFGGRPIDGLRIGELSEWASGLKRTDGEDYSPVALNHQLQTVRRLLTWAYDAGILATPYRLATLAPVPLPPPKPKALKPAKVSEAVTALYGLNPALGRLYLLAFWAALRPSEVGRVVRRDWSREDSDGSTLPDGCYRLQVSKTRKRIVILTPDAEALLAGMDERYCAGHESQLNHAVQRAREWLGDTLPPIHPMRHSAATAMIDAGVSRDHVEAALGHTLPRVQASYTRHPLTLARESMRLLVQLVPEPVGVEVQSPQQRKWAAVKAAGNPRRKGAKAPGRAA